MQMKEVAQTPNVSTQIINHSVIWKALFWTIDVTFQFVLLMENIFLF
jgi:hypothetical protein